MHEVAIAGFADPDDYEAARPSYPPAAVSWIAREGRIVGGARVADLAAGTGKLTRLLAPTGAAIVALEPGAGMVALLATGVPDVPAVRAVAEALPVRDAAFDAVTVAQAWHWFDEPRAARELRRVLRPNGRLVLAWNARDRSVDWVDAIWSIMDRVEKRAPWRDHAAMAGARELPGFDLVGRAGFHHVHHQSPADVVRRVASVSHVAVLPDGERAQVLEEVRSVLAGLGGPATVGIPYRVDCFAYERR